MRTTCLIFDVDGTLVDSAGFEDTLYKAALRSVLGDVFLRAAWSEYEHVTDVGLLREICRDNGLSAAQFEQQVRACFGELVAAHLQRAGPCRPTPGAIRLWDTLRAD